MVVSVHIGDTEVGRFVALTDYSQWKGWYGTMPEPTNEPTFVEEDTLVDRAATEGIPPEVPLTKAEKEAAAGTSKSPLVAGLKAEHAKEEAALEALDDPTPRGDPDAPQGTGSPAEPTAPSGNPLPGPAKDVENQYADSPPELVLQQSFTADRDSPKPYEKPGVYAPPAKLKSEVEDDLD